MQKLKITVIPAHAGIQRGRDNGVVSLDSGLGFGILRRSTACIHAGVRRNDGKVWMSGES